MIRAIIDKRIIIIIIIIIGAELLLAKFANTRGWPDYVHRRRPHRR